MKNIISAIFGCVLGCIATFIFFTHSINKESTSAIENEISQYKITVDALSKEISRYQDSLYPTLLMLQKATYQDIIAALEAKKVQLAHWIVFTYPSATAPVVKSETSIAAIENEITAVKTQIEADKRESAKYGECLLKSLIDVRIAQTQLSLAGLERERIAQKYGLALLGLPASSRESAPDKPKRPENPVEDKNAL